MTLMRRHPFVALFFIAVPFLLLAPLMVRFAEPGQNQLTTEAAQRGTTNPTLQVYTHGGAANLTITAVPVGGQSFDHWTVDDQTTNETPIALRMTQDGTLQPVSNSSSSNSGQGGQSFSLNVPSMFILVPAIVVIACCFIRYLVPIGRTIGKEKAPPGVNKARLILALVSIFIVVGPLGSTLIVYSGNLSGVFTPSNVNKLTNMLSSQGGFEMPNVTNSWCNLTSGTLFLQFNFTNPTAISLSIISASANVTDHSDGYPLGQISLPSAVTVGADETMTFQMTGTLSEEAIMHVATAHAGESSFDVDLSNENINCAGIMLQINQTSTIDNVLILR